eukprot:395106-Pelagomonas_calceolata.AAC.2
MSVLAKPAPQGHLPSAFVINLPPISWRSIFMLEMGSQERSHQSKRTTARKERKKEIVKKDVSETKVMRP